MLSRNKQNFKRTVLGSRNNWPSVSSCHELPFLFWFSYDAFISGHMCHDRLPDTEVLGSPCCPFSHFPYTSFQYQESARALEVPCAICAVAGCVASLSLTPGSSTRLSHFAFSSAMMILLVFTSLS